MTWSDVRQRTVGLVRRVLDVVAGLMFWLVYRGKGEVAPPINNLLLLESASALALKIRTRKLRSEDVVSAFIARIREVQPVLNCVVDERFEAALADARAADQLVSSSEPGVLEREQPLLGVPFTTKDAISVQGMSFTAGLWSRRGTKAERDSETVRLLREAGAIPLAITNVSEVCMWWESNNTVHGRTSNPYGSNHIVGGSSGGEGCIQAAAASPLGLGSDIGGSIRMPCFFNGIFGHKPSRGTVSNDGEWPPASEIHDTYLGTGPMCRFACDLLPTFKILAKHSLHQLKLDQKVELGRVRVFYMEDDGGSPMTSPVHPEIRAALRKVVGHLESVHRIKPQKANIRKMNRAMGIWFAKMRLAGEPDFSEQLANLQGRVNVWLELLKWPFSLSRHTLVALLTAISESVGVQPGTPKHQHLFQLCDRMRHEIQDLLGDDGVLLYPTHPTPAPYHNEPLIKALNFSYTAIFNVLGLPATAVPLGLSKEGLPIGIQVVGSLHQDHLTLAMAVELEKAFGGWVPPAVSV